MATGDIVGVTILGADPHNGWVAEVEVEGWAGEAGTITYDFGYSDITNQVSEGTVIFTVVSEGFNASAVLGTISRTVLGTREVRKAFPNEADADERDNAANLILRIALSDFIYNDDKDGGAGTSGTDPLVSFPAGTFSATVSGDSAAAVAVVCTNNSTQDYSKPLGRWAFPDRSTVTSDFLLEAVFAHRHGMNGRPVAAVQFDAADQSANSSATITTSALTKTTRSTRGKIVSVYAATMDIDALDTGEVIDCNFKAFPFVGDNDATLDSRTTGDGDDTNTENMGPFRLLNDKAGLFGDSFAVVDAISGNDGTGAAAATASVAASNPFLTISAAIIDIKAFNNTTYTRNTCDKGVVALKDNAAHIYDVTAFPVLANIITWMTIRSAAGESASITSSNGVKLLSGWVKFEGLAEFSHAQAAGVIGNGASTSKLWFDEILDISMTGAQSIGLTDEIFVTNCVLNRVVSGFAGFGTDRQPVTLFRGNDFSGVPYANTSEYRVFFYCLLGNTGKLKQVKVLTANAGGHQISDNVISAFNNATLTGGVFIEKQGTADVPVKGVAYLGNIIEGISNAGSPILQEHDDGTDASFNVIFHHNTHVGERDNHGYNDTGSTPVIHRLWSEKFNSRKQFNTKGDIFITKNGGRTGNWMVAYKVGYLSNQSFEIESADFDGEWEGLDRVVSDQLYTDDQSEEGGNVGGGDYTPGTGSPLLTRIDSLTDVSLSFDLDGNAIAVNGNTGAVQPLAAVGGGTNHGLNTGIGVSLITGVGNGKVGKETVSVISNPEDQ